MGHNFTVLKFCAILLPSFLVLTACKPKSNSPTFQPVVIEIITNATEIAAAKKDWADFRETRLQQFLAYPDSIRSFDRESLALVREHRQQSVQALTNLRDAPSTPPKVKIQAICALKLLDVSPSPDQLLTSAKNSTEATLILFSELMQSDGLFPQTEPLPDAIKTFVVASLSSQEPRIRSEAAHLAAWRGISEAAEPLARLIQQQTKPDLALLKSAARLCPSPEVLRNLEPELKNTDIFSGSGVLGAIADLAEATTNTALKTAAANLCVRHLKQQPDHPFIDGDTMAAVHVIPKALPPENAKTALADLARSGKWRHMREMALAALEEIDPASARALSKETGLALNKPSEPANATPKPSASELAATSVKHGVLTQAEAENAVKNLANRRNSPDAPASDSAEELFDAAGRFITFDVETGTCPNRHDLLLEDFAKASAGLFQPEAALEHYEDPNAGKQGWVETGQGKYTVQFIMRNRLYRFNPNDLGDWYDVAAVVAAIHQALDDAGISERFVTLESGGQDAGFIFAKPQPLAAAATELNLTLGHDLDQARKLGKTAEDRILQQLRN